MKNKKTWGIVLLVFGIMAAIGAVPNKLYEKLESPALSDIFTVLLIAFFIVRGIILIIQSKKDK